MLKDIYDHLKQALALAQDMSRTKERVEILE
jgi:hypothetical protein